MQGYLPATGGHYAPPEGMPLNDYDFEYEPDQKSKIKSAQRFHTDDDYREAKDYLNELESYSEVNPLIRAELYRQKFPTIPAEPLRRSPRDEQQEAWRKFNRTGKPAARLFGCLDQPHLYTLHTEHLGLPKKYGDILDFDVFSYDPLLMNAWKTALKEAIKPPYFFKLETANRYHVHIIAAKDAGLSHLARNGEVIKPIKAGDEMRVLSYLYKPHAPYTADNLAIWFHARREHSFHLPHVKGYVGLPSVKVWNA